MAALTVTAARIAVLKSIEQINGPAAETITAGQYVRLNTTNGKIELGNASSAGEARAGGIAANSAIAGEDVTMIRKGWLDMGDALGDLTYDDDVYLNDTDGVLGDAAGTVSLIVGTVIPVTGNTTADKALRVNL